MPNNATKPKTYPFTLRLTAQQRALLEKRAGDIPVGEYVRRIAFQEKVEEIDLSKDQVKEVACWVLGNIGQSHYCEHIGVIAQSIQHGAVILSPDETAVIIQACADIAAVREKLMRLSGLRKAANDH